MATKAQVLVQLLEKIPDPDMLHRLLELDNLLYLLQQYGHQKNTLQQRMSSGTLAEELLLELLEHEPRVYELLVQLHDDMDTRIVKKVQIFPPNEPRP